MHRHDYSVECPECERTHSGSLELSIEQPGDGDGVEIKCSCGFIFSYRVVLIGIIEDVDGNELERI